MDINSKIAKQYARLGPRATYGLAMLELVENNSKVFALSADLGGSSGLQRLMNSHPDRFYNVGIAEQNLIGVAAGFAKEGLVPFVSSFAPFVSLRCADQIRMNMGYMHLNIKVVALGSGVSMGGLGNSHYGLEDIAFIRSIPGITILSPADNLELVNAINEAAEIDGPVYIRLTGEPGSAYVYEEDYSFEVGKSVLLEEGEEICIISTGAVTGESLKAVQTLKEAGLRVSLINMHTIKPVDEETIRDAAVKYKHIVCVEEHSVIGGLGSLVSEIVASIDCKTIVHRIGIEDCYPKAGEYRYVLQENGLLAENIVEYINKIM